MVLKIKKILLVSSLSAVLISSSIAIYALESMNIEYLISYAIIMVMELQTLIYLMI